MNSSFLRHYLFVLCMSVFVACPPAAVTWLKYCRYGVKLYPINQSINQGIAHLVLVGSNPSSLAFLAGPCSNRSPGSPSTDNSSRRSPRPSASGTRTERVRASGRGPPPSHDFCQACSLGKYRQRIAVVRRVHNNTDYRRHPDFK